MTIVVPVTRIASTAISDRSTELFVFFQVKHPVDNRKKEISRLESAVYIVAVDASQVLNPKSWFG